MTLARHDPTTEDVAAFAEAEGIIIPPCDLELDEPELESDWHRDPIERFDDRQPKERAQPEIELLRSQLRALGVDPDEIG